MHDEEVGAPHTPAAWMLRRALGLPVYAIPPSARTTTTVGGDASRSSTGSIRGCVYIGARPHMRLPSSARRKEIA